ncbi:MAG: tetratricopeptide repeat protein [Nannocystaceae bacterium]|nr:serine/threonine-protein kinase [bacterium]
MSTNATRGVDDHVGDSHRSIDTATVALSSSADSIAAEPGMAKKIGRHVVLEQIGRGGMGSVYRAYDPELQREVALKRLRAKSMGLDGRARFEQEARAMAALSHPNVVGVYDVEVVEGSQLVLVMEYIDGPTLRTWVRQAKRPWQEVLVPFLDAARGLAAAHRAGLLHRDFKPANVLVTDEQAKVTDFGLAKRAKDLTGSGTNSSSSSAQWEDIDEDDLTRAGEVMGTPRYMAPEQHHGRELTPAVDQFAFCVALWEALTSTAPFTGEELARKKAKGPPEWTTTHGPRWLGDALRRGMEPEPERRWPDMDALIAALSRDPARRRARLLQVSSLAGLVAIAGGAAYVAGADGPGPCSGSALQLEQEWGTQARADVRVGMTSVDVVYAQSLWKRVDRRLDDYAQAWIAGHRSACEATVRKEHSAALRDLRVGCLDRGRIAFRAVIGQLENADVDVLRSVDTMIDELPDLARCGDLAALQEGTNPPAAKEAAAVAAVRDALELAKVDRLAAHFDQAERQLDEVEASLRAIDYQPVLGAYQLERGKLFVARGRPTLAEQAFRDALRLAVQTRDWDRTAEASANLIRTVAGLGRPDEILVLREVAESAAKGRPALEADVTMAIGLALAKDGQFEPGEALMRRSIQILSENTELGDQRIAAARNNLATVLRRRGQLDEAEAEFRAAIDQLTRALGPDHPKNAIVRGNLAAALRAQGRLEEAEREARAANDARLQSLGADHLLYGTGKTILADILADARKFDEAESEAKKGIEIIRGAVGRVHSKSADAVNSLGRVHVMRGKAAEAEKAFRETLAIRRELHGSDAHPSLGGVHLNIASTLRRQGRLEEAEESYQAAQKIWVDAFGPTHPDVAAVHNNLGVLYLDMERYEDSKAQSEQALRIKRALGLGVDTHELDTRSNLASALAQLGQLEEAEAERREVLSVLEERRSPDDPWLALNRMQMAELLLQRGKNEEARELAKNAWTSARKDGLSLLEQGEFLMTLSRSTLAAGDSDEARRLAEQALQLFVQAGVDAAGEAQQTRDWLAAHTG